MSMIADETARRAEMMKIDLSYLTDPNWWGRQPAENKPHQMREEPIADQIKRHRDTAARLIELAAWNMREAERLAQGSKP